MGVELTEEGVLVPKIKDIEVDLEEIWSNGSIFPINLAD